MAGPYILDRCRETTTSTGTGAVTLAGAVTGYQSFAAVGTGNSCYYCIEDGTNYEIGIGTYTASGTTLSRTTVLASSNSNAAVSFGAGTKNVFVTAPAAWFGGPLAAGSVLFAGANGLVSSDSANFTYNSTSHWLKVKVMDVGGETYNVRPLCAANGVTDDGPNINLITAAYGAAGGGEVTVPPGVYAIATPIELYSKVTLALKPGAYLLWTGASGGSFFKNGSKLTPLVGAAVVGYGAVIDPNDTAGIVFDLSAAQHCLFAGFDIGDGSATSVAFRFRGDTVGIGTDYTDRQRFTIWTTVANIRIGTVGTGILIEGSTPVYTTATEGSMGGVTDSSFRDIEMGDVRVCGVNCKQWCDNNKFEGVQRYNLRANNAVGMVQNDTAAGYIVSIGTTAAGTNYSLSPLARFTVGGVRAAAATALLGLTSATVASQGAGGYTNGDVVTLSGGARGAVSATVQAGGSGGYVVGDVLALVGGTSTFVAQFKVTAVSGGAVTAVALLFCGSYTALPSNPVATTGPVSGRTGCTLNVTWGAQATATLTVAGGVVTAVTPATVGGYSVIPGTSAVAVTGGSGSGLTLNPVWKVGQLVLIDGGTGYTSCTVGFYYQDGNGSGATATATLTSNAVTSLSLTAGGTGLTMPPVVTFTDQNSVTSAVGYATLDTSAHTIVSVLINYQGAGYGATAPTIDFVGGGSVGAAAASGAAVVAYQSGGDQEVGVYANGWQMLAVDAFGSLSGRVGIKLNRSRRTQVFQYHDDPNSEGGIISLPFPNLTADQLSYEIHRDGAANTGTLDIFSKGMAFRPQDDLDLFSNLSLNLSTSSYGIHQCGGQHRLQAVATPSAPTISGQSGSGTNSWFWVVAADKNGNKTLQSASLAVSNSGNPTGGTLTVTWPTGAWTLYVLKTSSSSFPSGTNNILLATLTYNTFVPVTTQTTVDNVAQASLTSFASPTRNTTADALLDGQLSVGTAAAPTAIVTLGAGAAAANLAPLKFTSGTNQTTAEAGAFEYDGAAFYNTADATNGRRASDAWNYFRLTGSGTGITTIADFFGANSAIPLVANGVYEVEWVCYFSQATAGTATWTVVTATTALANLTGEYVGSPVGGIGAVGTPQTAGINVTSSSSAAFPVTGTEANGATHYFRVRALLTAGNGASNVRLRLTMSAGTATPLINSFFRVRRLPGGNTGAFVA